MVWQQQQQERIITIQGEVEEEKEGIIMAE